MTDDIADLTRRVQRLEARELIAEVMAEYLYQVDRAQDPEALLQLFTEDAIWEGLGHHDEQPPTRGREAIIAMLVDLPASFSLTAHFITNAVITLSLDGLTARGRWHALELVSPRKPVDELVEVAWYDNDFAVENGRWQLRHVRYEDSLVFPYSEGWRNTRFVSLFSGDRIGHDAPTDTIERPT